MTITELCPFVPLKTHLVWVCVANLLPLIDVRGYARKQKDDAKLAMVDDVADSSASSTLFFVDLNTQQTRIPP